MRKRDFVSITKSQRFILITALFITGLQGSFLFGQPKVSWEVLADVTFIEQSFGDFGITYQIPTFGEAVEFYEGKEVFVVGYIIPQDGKNAFYVLSKNPFSACFFCGAAGPETVIELDMKAEAVKRYKMDQRLMFKGTLQLNREDRNRLVYILKDAEPYE